MFIVSTKEFQRSAAIAAKLVPSNASHPILATVLIESLSEGDTGFIRLKAFDLSIAVEMRQSASVEGEWAFAVDAKLLAKIVGKAVESDLSFSLDEETHQLIIKDGSSLFKLPLANLADWPEIPTMDDVEGVEVFGIDLEKAIALTEFAASDGPTKMVLSGLNFGTNGKVAATDGHRASVAKLDRVSGGLEDDVTIPIKAFALIRGLLDDDLVTIQDNSGLVRFTMGKASVTARRLDGTYPAYEKLFPKEFEQIVNINRAEFLSAIERVSVVAHKDPLVRLNFTKETLTLTTEEKERGISTATIPVSCGGDIEIAFRSQYLLEPLKALDCEEITLQINCPNNGKSSASVLKGDSFEYLVMPLHIRK